MKAKEIEDLNCDDSTGSGARLAVCARLAEMCGFRAAALDWSDPKGVHDMRVASRRLRSALRDFKPYLRKRKLAHAADELKRVADALGAVRDEDVAVMALEDLQAEAPADIAAGIARLIDERRDKRETARAALIKAIAEEKLDSLQAEFVTALERATAPRRHQRKQKGSAGELSFREVGREIISTRLAELRDMGACLYQPFETAALHRMRIAAKRLRYAMQLFAPCWGKALAAHAAEIAELQASLGKLHDCDVWLKGFGQMLRDFQEREDKDDSPLIETDRQIQSAAVWLLSHFAKARMKQFSHAVTRWHQWETSGFMTEIVAGIDARTPAIELAPLTLSATEAVAADIESQKPA